MLDPQRSRCHNKKNEALLTAARLSGGKDECQIGLTGNRMGTEISRLGDHGF